MMKKWQVLVPVIVLLFLALALAPAVAADSTYVVKPGDNLFRIALNHGLTTQQLAQANGIINPDTIYAGQTLIIPDGSNSNSAQNVTAPAAATSTGATTYLVNPGDNLFRVALNHGLSTHALAQANGITNYDRIYAGQVLTIPSGDGAVASTNTASASPPPPPAANYASGERWIDVNLSTQRLTAYEGNQAVYSSLISSGTWAYPTVTGQFHIWLRYEAQTMNGYRLGYDYYLPNVPYVMYFYKDYALHGTYWHNNFGTPMSHGCVNLPTPAAQWLYNWSSYGTMVNVHY
jgi:lipoprotein-anchoring transpeptidase ErfK/SrfK